MSSGKLGIAGLAILSCVVTTKLAAQCVETYTSNSACDAINAQLENGNPDACPITQDQPAIQGQQHTVALFVPVGQAELFPTNDWLSCTGRFWSRDEFGDCSVDEGIDTFETWGSYAGGVDCPDHEVYSDDPGGGGSGGGDPNDGGDDEGCLECDQEFGG